MFDLMDVKSKLDQPAAGGLRARKTPSRLLPLLAGALLSWHGAAQAALTGFGFEGEILDVAGEQAFAFQEERDFWGGFVGAQFSGQATYPDVGPVSVIDDTTTWNFSEIHVQTDRAVDLGAGPFPAALSAGGTVDSLLTIIDDCVSCPIPLDQLQVLAMGPGSLTFPGFPAYDPAFAFYDVQSLIVNLEDLDGIYPGDFSSAVAAPNFFDLPPLSEFEDALLFINVRSEAGGSSGEPVDVAMLGLITGLTPLPVPEPSTWALLCLGLLGFGVGRSGQHCTR